MSFQSPRFGLLLQFLAAPVEVPLDGVDLALAGGEPPRRASRSRCCSSIAG